MTPTSQGYVVAFDFGLRHIGVAVGQFVTRTASPLTTLSANDGKPDWEQVRSIVEEWRPQSFVVGLPLNMDDSESDMSERARAFAGNLERRFELPVHLVDERLTTFEAKHIDPDDAHDVSAQLIAETYLADG